MGQSTLQHDEDSPPVVSKGHGVAALGPSDSSDSGSDVQGSQGVAGEDLIFTQAGDDSDEIAASDAGPEAEPVADAIAETGALEPGEGKLPAR